MGWPDSAAAPAGPTGAQVGGLLCAAAVPLAAAAALLAWGAGEPAAGPAGLGTGTGTGGPKPPCPDRRWWLRKVGWSLGLALYYTFVASPVFVAVVGPYVAGTCASRFGDYKAFMDCGAMTRLFIGQGLLTGAVPVLLGLGMAAYPGVLPVNIPWRPEATAWWADPSRFWDLRALLMVYLNVTGCATSAGMLLVFGSTYLWNAGCQADMPEPPEPFCCPSSLDPEGQLYNWGLLIILAVPLLMVVWLCHKLVAPLPRERQALEAPLLLR